MSQYIRRRHFKKLENSLYGNINLIQVIVGPRQVGKTTLALQLIDSWKGPRLYETADQPNTPPLEWLDRVWSKARRLALKKGRTLFVVDEVQKIPGWSELVKKLFDEDKRRGYDIRVVLLGSSSLLVQKGLSESLAGRFELHRHFQWSFGECREAFGVSLEEYLFFGGYPAGLGLRKEPDRWAGYIRDSLIETVLAKDILLISPISKPALLRQTFSLAISHPSQIISYQKMLGTLTDAGNVTTIASYLKLLSAAFLVHPLERYSGAIVKQRGSIPKIVVLDNALISATNNLSFGSALKDPAWRGRLIENMVGAKILFLTEEKGGQLFYWRERNREVDFIVKIGEKLLAIEVKSGRSRNLLKNLGYFLEKNPDCQGLVIGDSNDNPPAEIPQVRLEEFLVNPRKYLT